MRHHTSTAAQLPMQAWAGTSVRDSLPSPDMALLQFANIVHDTRVVLIGPDTLELLCALIRLDCGSAAAVRLLDRPKAGTADLVILPAMASVGCIDAGLVKARRVLAPLGSVILRFAGLPCPALVRHARRVLQMHGFQAIHARQLGHQYLLTAELPLVRRLACAWGPGAPIQTYRCAPGCKEQADAVLQAARQRGAGRDGTDPGLGGGTHRPNRHVRAVAVGRSDLAVLDGARRAGRSGMPASRAVSAGAAVPAAQPGIAVATPG